MNKKFKLWAISDAHVGTDIKYGRESLAEAVLQSENSFDWDVCVNLGDFSGSQIAIIPDPAPEIVAAHAPAA